MAVGTFATRREASDALATVRAEVRDGLFIGPAASRVSFEFVVGRWWQTREGHRPSTRARDWMVLDPDVLPDLGNAQLRKITHAEVQTRVNRLAARLAPSVQRSFTVLRQVLDFAVDTRALSVNLSERTRLPRRQRFEARFLTPDELERLASMIDPRSRTMVLVMARAALRIGEAIGLRRSNLDLRTGRLWVANNVVEVSGRLHEGPPKTSAERRTMRLPPSVVAEPRLHVLRFGGSRYVSPLQAAVLLRAQEWSVKVWRPAVEAAGLAPLRPHHLKHTGVALLAGAGVDPPENRAPSGTFGCCVHLRLLRPSLFPEADTQATAKLDVVRLGAGEAYALR